MVIDRSDFRRVGVSGGQSDESSGMVSAMTPTASSPTAGPHAPPAPAVAPHEDAVGPTTWYLGDCFRCSDVDLAVPFRTEVERDDWAATHVAAGHTAILSVDALGSDAPPARVLRRTFTGPLGFRILCTGKPCIDRGWMGPFDTPQLALAAGRKHRCEPAR